MITNFVKLPKGKKVWDHQHEAFNKVKDKPGGMLAMGMRTGKTLVAVGLSTYYEAERVLILAPINCLGVWERDFPLSTKKYKVLLLDQPGTKNKLKQLAGFKSGVVVVNYEAAWRSPLDRKLIEIEIDLVIYDEIHRIKSPGGKSSKFCSRLKGYVSRRLGLTGTLLPHSPFDAYAQFRALDISIFGNNNYEFKKEYGEMEQLKLRKPLMGKHGANKGKMINEVSVVTNFKNMKSFAARMARIRSRLAS